MVGDSPAPHSRPAAAWPPNTGISVDFFYLFPYEGAIDPGLLEQESGKPQQPAVVLEDVAVASGISLRLQAVLRRLESDQRHLLARQERHSETLASNERRLLRWAAAEIATLTFLSFAQFALFKLAFRNY